MKSPYRQYWKITERILENVTFSQPAPPYNTVDWIQEIPFFEIATAEDVLRRFAENPVIDLEGFPEDWARIKFQLCLRFAFADDFCKGAYGKRAEFDWGMAEERAWKWLLSEHWMMNALNWASRNSDLHFEHILNVKIEPMKGHN